MAQQTVVSLTCDIEGNPDARTYAFNLAGKAYLIDLDDDCAAELRARFAPFAEHARKVTAPAAKPRDRNRSAAIRAFARERYPDLAPRGRFPNWLVKEYEAAQS